MAQRPNPISKTAAYFSIICCRIAGYTIDFKETVAALMFSTQSSVEQMKPDNTQSVQTGMVSYLANDIWSSIIAADRAIDFTVKAGERHLIR